MLASSAGRAAWPRWRRPSHWWPVRLEPDRAVLVSLAGVTGGKTARRAGRRCWRAGPGAAVQAVPGVRRRTVVRRRVGGGGLGGVLLGVAEFGDGFGERGQPGDEHDRGHGRGRRSGRRTRTAAGRPGGAGSRPGWAAGCGHRVGGRRGRRRRRPGAGCGCRARRQPRAGCRRWPRRRQRRQPGRSRPGPDLRGGVGGGAGGVIPDRVPLRGGEPVSTGRDPVRVHRCRSLGQVRSAASFPPPYQTGSAVLGGVAGQGDRVPGDLAGVAWC